MDSIPILSLIAYIPAIGALAILLAPRSSQDSARKIAVVASIASFLLSLVILVKLKHNADFQFTEHHVWLKDLGISYFMGVDGISTLLIVLTTLITLISIVWSYDTINVRRREYYIAILLLETGMIGVFMALDLFIFYIFWELMLIPMALLIGIWGSTNRVYAATKFFLYTLFGSLLMLVGIVATYQSYFQQTGIRTLNILELQAGHYSTTFQFWVFAAFLVAFAVKVPMFPFHTWLPDAHVQAPTAASVILASVMLKMGGYGLLRFNLPLFPDATRTWTPYIIGLSVIAIIYGALVALVQPDMKKLIAYSSVSHMGFVTLGLFVANMQGMDGAMMVMLAHGLNTGGLFLVVGVIYERAHTRDIAAFGGLATRMPRWAVYFCIFMFASIGLPGLSGFVGEFLVTLGTWHYNRWAAVISFSVVIFSAWYMMWMFQRVVFGRASGEAPDPGDTALLPSEVQELAALGGGHGHDDHNHNTGTPLAHGGLAPVSGGAHGLDSHDHDHGDADSDSAAYPTHPGQLDSSPWPDLTRKETLTLLPLAVLTLVFGFYPKPLLQIVEPSFQAILDHAMRVVGN